MILLASRQEDGDPLRADGDPLLKAEETALRNITAAV